MAYYSFDFVMVLMDLDSWKAGRSRTVTRNMRGAAYIRFKSHNEIALGTP